MAGGSDASRHYLNIPPLFITKSTQHGVGVLQKNNALPSMIFGGVLIALIAAVTGWSMKSRVASNTSSLDQVQSNGVQPEDRVESAPPTVAQGNAPVRIGAIRHDPRGFLQANDASTSKLITAGRQKLRSQYESEKVDPAWASRKQSALKAASNSPQMDQIGAKPLSFDSQCRSSVCLIGADFASSSTADDWFTLYTLTAASEMSNASVSRVTNPDGTIHLQIYGRARK